MDKVLITGHKGMLGSSLIKELQVKEVENVTFDRGVTDLSNPVATNVAFELNKDIDSVIHCAAKVGGVIANMNNNEDFFKENVSINQNTLQSSLNIGVKNLVSILSTCVFPNEGVTYPLTSDQLDNGSPHPSNTGYSYAKRLLHYQTKMYREFTGNNWISVVPTNLYGRNDNYHLENSHLIPALIRKAYEASLTGDDFYIWGSGTPLRQFMFADDLSKVIFEALDTWKSSDPFMAVNPKEYSIKEVATVIADRFNLSGKMKFQSDRPDGQFKKTASTDVREDFEFTSLEDGINQSIDWFVENYDTCRK
jgi:GDP-L-fucose synthase